MLVLFRKITENIAPQLNAEAQKNKQKVYRIIFIHAWLFLPSMTKQSSNGVSAYLTPFWRSRLYIIDIFRTRCSLWCLPKYKCLNFQNKKYIYTSCAQSLSTDTKIKTQAELIPNNKNYIRTSILLSYTRDLTRDEIITSKIHGDVKTMRLNICDFMRHAETSREEHLLDDISFRDCRKSEWRLGGATRRS